MRTTSSPKILYSGLVIAPGSATLAGMAKQAPLPKQRHYRNPARKSSGASSRPSGCNPLHIVAGLWSRNRSHRDARGQLVIVAFDAHAQSSRFLRLGCPPRPFRGCRNNSWWVRIEIRTRLTWSAISCWLFRNSLQNTSRYSAMPSSM